MWRGYRLVFFAFDISYSLSSISACVVLACCDPCVRLPSSACAHFAFIWPTNWMAIRQRIPNVKLWTVYLRFSPTSYQFNINISIYSCSRNSFHRHFWDSFVLFIFDRELLIAQNKYIECKWFRMPWTMSRYVFFSFSLLFFFSFFFAFFLFGLLSIYGPICINEPYFKPKSKSE